MDKKKSNANSKAKQTTQTKKTKVEAQDASPSTTTRNILIGVIAAVVIAIVVSLVAIFSSGSADEAESGAESDRQFPEMFAGGEPILVSSEGISAASLEEESSALNFYYDYTCGGCIYVDYMVGTDLIEKALAGDFVLTISPVKTHNAAYNVAATAVALGTAANSPEHFVAVQEALVDYSYNAMLNNDTEALDDLELAVQVTYEIAANAGVPEDVIGNFSLNGASEYLDASSELWVERNVADRGGAITSPEFVYDGKKLEIAGEDSELLAYLLDQIGIAN